MLSGVICSSHIGAKLNLKFWNAKQKTFFIYKEKLGKGIIRKIKVTIHIWITKDLLYWNSKKYQLIIVTFEAAWYLKTELN